MCETNIDEEERDRVKMELSLEAHLLHYSPIFSLVVILGRAIRVQDGSGDDAIELCEFRVALQDLLLNGGEHAFSISWRAIDSQWIFYRGKKIKKKDQRKINNHNIIRQGDQPVFSKEVAPPYYTPRKAAQPITVVG